MNDNRPGQALPETGDIGIISPERVRAARFLYFFAWALEITAVIIGLAIGLSIILSSLESMQVAKGTSGLSFAESTNTFIAAVPLLMVAMVEISKIPLTEAFYGTSSRMWKWILGFALLFVAMITFESALNGFERGYSMLMYSISDDQKELFTIDEQVAKIDADRAELQALTAESIDTEFNNRYAELFKQSNEQKRLVTTQIDLLRGSIKSEAVDNLRIRLDDAKAEKQRLLQAQSDEMQRLTRTYSASGADVSEEVATQRRSYQEQIAREERRLADFNKSLRIEVEKAFILTKASVRAEWEERITLQERKIENLREELNSLGTLERLESIREQEQRAKSLAMARSNQSIALVDQQIQELSDSIARSIGAREKDIEENVAVYQEQLRGLDTEFQTQLAVIEDSRDASYVRLANNTEILDQKSEEKDSLETKRIDLERQINKKVADNQWCRIATWFSDEDSPARVDKTLVSLVATVWSASLALLIAIMGILLCLASLVLADPRFVDKNKETEERARGLSQAQKFWRTLRWAFVARRRSQQKRVEIVEVDKVVFKEIPVETVKKEFVHIPFYTNDEKLLNLSGKDARKEDAEGDQSDN